MKQLVLLRHGESEWNRENRFTGWTDVDLTEKGIAEAKEAGRSLASSCFEFDFVFCSVLKRAIRTAWIVLDEMDRMWIPMRMDWRLNERHYGALQGLNKAETAAKHGEEQVHIWRRSYDTSPPPLDRSDPRFPAHEEKYREVNPDILPPCESLKDTVARFLPCWHDAIAPEIRVGRRILIIAHGNSLRALVMHLDGLSPEAIMELNIPTGIPLVYEMDDDLDPLRHHYLGNEAAILARTNAVQDQGKAK